MDEVNLTTLRTPQFRTRTIQRTPRRDFNRLGDVVLDNSRIDNLIAKSPNILSRNTSLARKKLFLDDLQQQFRVNEALIESVPQQVAQRVAGRRVSRVGLRPLVAEAEGPLERDQLALASVIARVKGDISTAQRLARAAGGSSVSEEAALAAKFTAEAADNAEAIEASGQSLEEINAELLGTQARLQGASQEEVDRILALGDIAAETADAQIFQRLINAPIDVVLDEAEAIALRQQEQNIGRTATEAERIAQRINDNTLA